MQIGCSTLAHINVHVMRTIYIMNISLKLRQRTLYVLFKVFHRSSCCTKEVKGLGGWGSEMVGVADGLSPRSHQCDVAAMHSC